MIRSNCVPSCLCQRGQVIVDEVGRTGKHTAPASPYLPQHPANLRVRSRRRQANRHVIIRGIHTYIRLPRPRPRGRAILTKRDGPPILHVPRPLGREAHRGQGDIPSKTLASVTCVICADSTSHCAPAISPSEARVIMISRGRPETVERSLSEPW